jgi:hypothetical protein
LFFAAHIFSLVASFLDTCQWESKATSIRAIGTTIDSYYFPTVQGVMAAPIQLRWKPPPPPRAKPISQEIWKQHHTEIVLLYRSHTLDEIIDELGKKYDFRPS